MALLAADDSQDISIVEDKVLIAIILELGSSIFVMDDFVSNLYLD